MAGRPLPCVPKQPDKPSIFTPTPPSVRPTHRAVRGLLCSARHPLGCVHVSQTPRSLCHVPGDLRGSRGRASRGPGSRPSPTPPHWRADTLCQWSRGIRARGAERQHSGCRAGSGPGGAERSHGAPRPGARSYPARGSHVPRGRQGRPRGRGWGCGPRGFWAEHRCAVAVCLVLRFRP